MSLFSTNTGVAVVDTRIRSGTITLPLTSQIPNRYVQIKDLYGAFSRSSLTVSTQAGESFDDGTTSKVYTDPFTFLTLYAASTTKWAQLAGTQNIQQTVSSIIVSSITIGSGLGWLQMPPIQNIALSTNTINADTIITNSTTSGYISAQVLYVSSILGVTIGGGVGDVTKANLASTTLGLQSASIQFVSALTVNTLTLGSGAGWLQLPPVQTIYSSTIYIQAQALYSLSSYFGNTSTMTPLQFYGLFGNYNNTVLAEISTGVGTQELLMFKGSSTSDRVRIQTTGTFVVETGVSARLFDASTITTQSNVTPAFVINTSSNVGIQTASPQTTLDVAGTGRFLTLSTLALNISTINGQVYSAGGASGAVAIPNVSANTVSTGFLNVSSISANTLNVSTTATISSLIVNSLQFGDGTGWVNINSLQTVVLSSIQTNANNAYATNLYANTEYLGAQSTVNSLQFYGLFSNFNNTALAEISTGAGSQELLVFKGSSSSDRVRVQTTGAFVVETGVSSRLWSNTTVNTLSNVTPAFLINTSSNVGIQTASPQTTLDVAGTGRFQNVSTLNINLSTINGQVFGVPIQSTSIGLGTLGYISSSQLLSTTSGLVEVPELISTVTGLGQVYLSTATGGSSGAIPYVSAFTVSTSYVESSTISTFVMNAYGVFGSAFVNLGPDDLNITSMTNANFTSGGDTSISANNDLTLSNAGSTIVTTGSFYVNSLSNIFLNSPSQVYTSELTNFGTLSTHSLVIYGPSTLTVQGFSYFQNIVSSYSIVTGGLGILDSVTGQPSYITSQNGSIQLSGSAITSQDSLTSSIVGLGSAGYISTPGGISGVAQIVAGTNITISPPGGTGVVTINATGGGGGGPSEPVPYLSSYSLSTGYVFSPLQVGTVSTVTALEFTGLFNNYNNTVLAEISTGAGSQELLIFKGSSISDRVRFQTTGDVRFETGVSARLWSDNTLQTLSNTTPAMIIDTASNVGIQTASPQTTLDVAGTGRFQTLSTLALNISTINGQVYTPGGGGGGGGGGVTSIPDNLSTLALYTSSIQASTITTSTMQVNSLVIGTGTGWVNLGPLQTVALSSQQVFADTSFAITTSSISVYSGAFYGGVYFI